MFAAQDTQHVVFVGEENEGGGHIMNFGGTVMAGITTI